MNKNLIERVQKRPALFIEKVLGCDTLEDYQENICQAVADYDRVAISACHAVGKTFLMARIVLWFLYCFRGAKIITTAPTNRQVEFLLWGEIGVAVKRSPYNLGGHLTSKRLKIDDDWYAMGFSPAKTAGESDGEQKGSTFQGWHGDYILIVFDEATGVPPDVWTQVEGLLTSGKIVKFVCIANPTTKSCDFFDLFSLPSWKKIELSCFDSPNLKANGIYGIEELKAEIEELKVMDDGPRLDRIKNYKKPVPHLVSCQWVVEKSLEWGIDDPRFQSKALGVFPDVEDMVCIQAGTVKFAQSQTHYAKDKGARYIGIDVARFGDDKSVFTELIEADETGFEPVHTRTKKTAKKDLMETTGDVINFALSEWNGEKMIIAIDATGVGAGVYDRLKELQKLGEFPRRITLVELHYGMAVKSIQKNKKPTKKEEQEQRAHLNVKSLMYDDLDQALKKGLRLQKDSTYVSQLPTIRYSFTSNGKRVIESKKDYKKRTGKPSPDESDSLAQAVFARRFEKAGDYLRKLVK